MKLNLFKENYCIYRLTKDYESPICIDTKSFYYITNIEEELSVVCKSEEVEYIKKEWRIISITSKDNINFNINISKLKQLLNNYNVNILEIESLNKRYILIKDVDIEYACSILNRNGYCVIN